MTFRINQSKGSANAQRGYSLIELSIALAILSVVIVGSLVGVQRILANNRANNVLQSVPKINAAIIAGTANAPSVAMTTTLAANLGAFPDTLMVKNGNALVSVKNEFGGQYSLVSNSAAVGSSPINGGYFLHITNVPQSLCATVANGLSALSTGLWIQANPTTPVGVEAKAQAAPAAGEVESPTSNQLDATKVGTECIKNGLSELVAFIPIL